MKRVCRSAIMAGLKDLEKNKPIVNFKQWRFREPPSYSILPIDDDPEYNIPRAIKHVMFSKVPTEPIQGNLHLVCVAEEVLTKILDLDVCVTETELFKKFIVGSYIPKGNMVVAHRYGGHQFGFWSDQLGDGRAHILGEYLNRSNEVWQPQLKGSGETPYSRFGDGRAVLRSSIREMIASEACHHLGIPTTRAVALVVSDEHKVWRDKLNTGHAKQERAATLMRLAPAWYRIGSLEILQKRHEHKNIKILVDFIIENYYPSIQGQNKYCKWFTKMALSNIEMVCTWQGMGFTHGVMNSDNISLLGLTLDYGPFGFMDHYNANYVSNKSDGVGRYSFCNQPKMLLWSLDKLIEAIDPILSHQDKINIESMFITLGTVLTKKILNVYIKKLGIIHVLDDDDEKLIEDLFSLMQLKMADFTATFRQLSEVNLDDLLDKTVIETKWSLKKIFGSPQWETWVKRYRERVKKDEIDDATRRSKMLQVNPLYVPRNWMLQEAIQDAEKNDFEKVRFLLKLFKNPFEVNEEAERRGYSSQPPNWSYGLKITCSS